MRGSKPLFVHMKWQSCDRKWHTCDMTEFSTISVTSGDLVTRLVGKKVFCLKHE